MSETAINQTELAFHKGYEMGRQETIRNAEVMSRLLGHSVMPWRLQIAQEYMLKSMQCIHVGGQTQTTSLKEETALAMADALIAEHERTIL